VVGLVRISTERHELEREIEVAVDAGQEHRRAVVAAPGHVDVGSGLHECERRVPVPLPCGVMKGREASDAANQITVREARKDRLVVLFLRFLLVVFLLGRLVRLGRLALLRAAGFGLGPASLPLGLGRGDRVRPSLLDDRAGRLRAVPLRVGPPEFDHAELRGRLGVAQVTLGGQTRTSQL